MTIAKVTKDLSVSPQLSAQEIADAARAGFKTIINNRPDGEEKAQPSADALKKAAKDAGLEYRHIPVVPGQITDQQIDAFAAALEDLPKPALAFCRTGTRSISLWSLCQAGAETADSLIRNAEKAGYDISGLKDRIEERGAAR